jgi:hypothetical protein
MTNILVRTINGLQPIDICEGEISEILEIYVDRILIRKEDYWDIERAFNECGYNSTEVDIIDLLKWLKKNRPDLLSESLR